MNKFLIKIPYISFSLLAIDKSKRTSFIKQNNSKKIVDFMHIDISDNRNTLTASETKKYSKISDSPLDIHIAMKNPMPTLNKLNKFLKKDDRCCIHVENNIEPEKLKKYKKKFKFGIAINTETPNIKLKKYLKIIDYVLFMSASPGISGLGFNDKVISKIKKFNKKNIEIHADGGVNNINASILRESDVNLIVSGSYLMKGKSIFSQLSSLLGNDYFKNILHYSSKKIPKINFDESILKSLKVIDKYKMGIVLVYKKNKVCGILSDGDIRRYLIKKGNLNEKIYKITNKNFLFLRNYSLLNCIRQIKKIKNVSALPIINSRGKCIGIFNGIKA